MKVLKKAIDVPVLLALAVFVLLLLASGAQAQVKDNYGVEHVPAYTDLSLRDFDKNSKVYKVQPPGGPDLAFDVRVPHEWYQVESKSGSGKDDFGLFKKGVVNKESLPTRSHSGASGFLEPLAKFHGPDRGTAVHSTLRVETLVLDQDILASDWLANFIFTQGHNLQYLTPVSEVEAEALYVYVHEGTPYITRTKMMINGRNVILASYMLPEQFFNQERDYQFRVVESFRVLNERKVRVTPTDLYSFLDIMEFDYPKNWRLEAPRIDSLHEMEATLLRSKNDKSIEGRINMMVLSNKMEGKIPDRIRGMKSNIEDMGLTPGSLVETREAYDFNPRFKLSYVEVYVATDQDYVPKRILDHELWIALFYDGEYYLVMDLLTPSRQFDRKEWIENTQAFKIIVESLRI